MVPTRDRPSHGLTTMGRTLLRPPLFGAFDSLSLRLLSDPIPALIKAKWRGTSHCLRGRSLSEPRVRIPLVRHGIAAVAEASTRC